MLTEKPTNEEIKQLESQVAALEELLAAREKMILEQAHKLEQQIAERKQAEKTLLKRTGELETVAQVSQVISTVLSFDELLQLATDLTKERFELYHTHIYLLNEADDTLELAGGAGSVGPQMVAQKWRILCDTEHSLVAGSFRLGEGVIVNDIQTEPDFLPNPLLPDTRSEMAVPMIVGNKTIGVLDVQATEVDRFTQQDVQILTILAAQIAVALQNAQQYQQVEQQAAIIDSAAVFIGAADLQGNTVFLNRRGLDMAGYDSLDEVIGQPIANFHPPEFAETLQKEYLPQVFAEGSWRGESIFQTKNGQTFAADQTLFLVKDSQGEVQLIATSVVDITERKQAEEALKESESRYQQILDSITQMLLVKGEKSRIVWANKAFREYYGMSNQELQDLIDAPFNEPDYTLQYIKDDEYVFHNGEVLDIPEEPVTRHDGAVRLFHTIKSPIFDADGQVHMTVGVSEDITERKKTEEERLRLSQILESTTDWVSVATPDGQIIYINRGGREMIGLDPDEDVTKTHISEYYPKRVLPFMKNEVLPTVAKEGVWSGENVFLSRDGREIPILQVVTAQYSATGEVQYLSTIVRDITDRKQTEEETRQREALLRSLIDAIPDLIFYKDVDGTYLGCNPAFEAFVGKPAEEMVGYTDFDIFPTEVAEFFREQDQMMMTEGQARRNEEWVDYPDGSQHLLDTLKSPFYDTEGNLLGLIGISRDTTEQKKAEQQLRDNEARLAEATAMAKLYHWEFDFVSQQFVFSPEYYQFLGIQLETEDDYTISALEFAQKYVPPEEAANVEQGIQAAASTTEVDYIGEFESRIITEQGQVIPILVRFRVVRDAQGNPIRMIGTSQDVTEQKQIQEEIRAISDQQQTILDNAEYAILSTTPEGIFTSFNPAGERMLGYRAEEVVGKYTPAIVHDPAEVVERAKEFSAELGETIEPGFEVFVIKSRRNLPNQHEWTYIRKDGSRLPVSLQVTAVRDETGEITGFIGFAQDITEQKQAAAALQQSQDQLSEALQFSQLAYWECDLETMNLIFDDNLFSILEMTAEEFGGYVISTSEYAQKYVHPEDLPAFGDSVTKFLEADDPNYTGFVGYRVFRADGEEVYLETEFKGVRNEQGQLIKAIGMLQNVTERKRAEETQKQLTAELDTERSTLQAILDNLPLGVFVAEAPSGRPLIANSKTVELLGKGVDPNIAKDELAEVYQAYRYGTDEHYPPEEMPLVRGMLGESASINDMEIRRPDGSHYLLEIFGSPVRNAAGDVTSSVAIFQDITERRQAEQQLRDNEARLAEATAIAKLYQWEFDFASQQFVFSPEYYQFLGIELKTDEDYIMSAMEYAQNYVHPDNAVLVGQEVQAALTTTEANYYREIESRDVTKDGQIVPIVVRFRLIRDEQGHPAKLVGVNQDVTEQKRVEAAIAKQAAELQTVVDVSTKVTSALNEEDLLQEVVDLTKIGFDLYHAHIYVLDDEGETLVLTAGAGEVGRQMVSENRIIPLDHPHSIVALTARTGQGRIANNVRENSNFLPHPLLPETRAELATPMIVGDNVIGVFDVQSNVTDRFTEQDVRIKTTLASQVAVALQNARLFEQQRQIAAELEQQADRLAILNEMGAELNQVVELDEVYKIAAARTSQVFGGDRASVALLDSTGDNFEVFALDGEKGAISLGTVLPMAGTQIGQTVQENRLINTPDLEKGDFLELPKLAAQGLRSAMNAPLAAGGQVLGTLNVASKKRAAFSPADESLLIQVASLLASAIESRHLFEQTQSALTETETLYDLIGTLNNATTLDEALQVAISPTTEVDHAIFFTIEVDAAGTPEWIELKAFWDKGDQPLIPLDTRIFLPDFKLTSLWLNSEEPVLIGDINTDERLDVEERSFAKQLNFTAGVILPLKLGDVWIGLLQLGWTTPQFFSEKEKRLYQVLTAQMSVVVNNLLLLEQTQANLAETEKRYETVSRINEASSLQELIEIIVNEGPLNVFNRALLFIHERSEEQEVPVAVSVIANWHSGQGEPPSPVGRRYSLAEFPAFKLTLSLEPIFFNDALNDERLDAKTAAVAQRQNIRALAVLPLQTGGRLRGSLFLQSDQAYRFTPQDMQGYQMLLPQIATAVESQRLLAETRQILAELEAVQRRYTVQAWDAYRTKQSTYGYQKVDEQIMPLLDDRLPVKIDDIAQNLKANIVETALTTDISENGEADPTEVHSDLIVPLTVRNEVIGVLGLEGANDANKWSPGDIAVVEAIAEQIAQAAENIRLLDETQSRAARERRVNEIGDKIQAAQSLEEALQVAVKEVGLSLQAPQTTVQLAIDMED